MPKIVDRDQYRKELLMKSFDLFAEKGYGSLTMRQLAQGLGVSTGTLYHYFPTKEAIFEQLVEEQTQQDIMNFLGEASNAQTLPERIKALFSFGAKNEDYFRKQTLLWVEFYQQQGRTEVLNNETLKRACDATRAAIADYLLLQDKALIEFVYVLLNGLIVVPLFEGEKVSFSEQGELLAKMLTAYLEKARG